MARNPTKMLELPMRDEAARRVERLRQRRFEQLVARALQSLPPHVLAMLDNVEVVVEDEPTAEQVGLAAADGEADDSLFGLYEGVPLGLRGTGYTMVLPDRITLFRGPLERSCRSPAALAREVRTTVLHELGHHLGFGEERLEELGLG